MTVTVLPVEAVFYPLDVLALAEMAEPVDFSCEYCGERDATMTVDDSDPSVGYSSAVEMCAECCGAARRERR